MSVSDPGVPPRLPVAERRTQVTARAAALFLDTALLAYATWCVNFVVAWAAGEVGREGWLLGTTGFLGRRPWLLLLAPFVALLWESSGSSLGQRAHRLVSLDATGAPARLPRRAWRAVFAALQMAIIFLPLTLAVLRWHDGNAGGLHVVLSVLLLAAFAGLALVEPAGRGLPDLLAGTVTRRAKRTVAVRQVAWWRKPNAWVVLAVLVLTVAAGVLLTAFRPQELVANFDRTTNLWSRLFAPDWSITGKVLEKMVETVFLALMASALALPFAFVISFLGARNVMTRTTAGRVVYVVTRVFMNLTRSIEPLVWAIIFTLWVGVGPDAGMLALFVHSVAALGKLYSEAIESIDAGPVEAIQATGANALQVLRYGIVPQVIPPFLSFTVYRWDINVRMATILGMVGGGGIGMLLIEYQQVGAWAKVGTIIVFITLVVWAMDWASSKAREKLT